MESNGDAPFQTDSYLQIQIYKCRKLGKSNDKNTITVLWTAGTGIPQTTDRGQEYHILQFSTM
jgi:hypothetical protein